MNSIETGVRFEFVQLGGVLVLERPRPGEELVYDSIRYMLIDLRPVFGEWQSLARAGRCRPHRRPPTCRSARASRYLA